MRLWLRDKFGESIDKTELIVGRDDVVFGDADLSDCIARYVDRISASRVREIPIYRNDQGA